MAGRIKENLVWEELKPVDDYDEAYSICEKFRLNNLDTDRILKMWQTMRQILSVHMGVN